jgi:hypothetical protein
MDTGSPKLYQRRKKRLLDIGESRPVFATNTLRTHTRPHATLPELRVTERPEARLAIRPIEETPAYEKDKAIE